MSLKPTAPIAEPAVAPGASTLEHLATRTDLTLPEVLRHVCESAAEALRVERTGVWLFVNGDRTLRCVSLFERSKRRHTKGACLSLAHPSAYLQAVASASLLACEQARSDPRTAELDESYLAPNGITSLLDAPLLRDDRLIGVLAHEHVGQSRQWTDAERALARSAADLVVARMKSAEASLKTTPWQVVVPCGAGVETPAIDAAEVHQVRTLLNEILANTNLLGLSSGLSSNAASRLEKIRKAVERGLALLGGSDDSASNSNDDTGEHQPLSQASR